MGLRVRKSFKLAPGVRLKFGKRATSLALDGKGLTLNVGKKGARSSVPGRRRRAIYSWHAAYSPKGGVPPQNSGAQNPALAIGLVLLAVLSVVMMVMVEP
jgi:hypothetical protein